MSKEYFDRHHIIPIHPLDEDRGVKWISTPNNIVILQRNTHEAIHTLFKNTPPITQIVKLLDMYENCFDEKFYNEMIRFIQSYVNNWYKRECYKWTLWAEIRRVLDINVQYDKLL